MKTVKRILAGGMIVGLAVSLGACSSAPNPGTAVESLGVTYTESDITVATDELGEVLGQALPRQNVVSVVAAAQPYFQVAELTGVSPESPEVQQLLEGILAETGTEAEGLNRATLDAVTVLLVSQVMAPQLEDPEVPEMLDSLMSPPNTVINPRYGSFDPEQGVIPAGVLADVVSMNTP